MAAQGLVEIALADKRLLKGSLALLSQLALCFTLRVAEACSDDVFRIACSFSRLGICDDNLFGGSIQSAKIISACICKFTTDFDVTKEGILLIGTSCALVGYRSEPLLSRLTSLFSNEVDGRFVNLLILSQ